MIITLTLALNRTRQAGIMREIFEIVVGTGAMKG